MAVAVTKHVVLFPFPAQGHLSAFMSVAALLHRAVPDAAITLVSTPRNVAALQAAAAASGSSFLGFHTLPFVPSDHGLPADVESFDAVPGARFVDFFEAFEALQPALDDYLAAITATAASAGVVVVSDPFTAWTAAVARRRGCAAHALFVSCGAFGSAVLHSLWSHLPVHPDDPSGRVRLPEHPEVVIHRSQVSKYLLRAAAAAAAGGGGGEDRGAAFLGRQIAQGYETDAVLINTVEEFEPAGLAMLRRTLKVPVLPVGPLVHVGGGHRPVSPETDHAVLSFLDSHPPSSVLYVSFGSQHSIRAEHMVELAAALESTGRPFVWAVRPPDEHDGGTGDEWLPEGFEERARRSSRGLLVRGWAPQVRILAHPSTGTFLSHCGWNSVLESMAHGVPPIVGWPLSGEQFYNAKMLEEDWGVCVEVARGNVEGTVVERRAVAGVVETVMGRTEKAAEMRRRAREVKAVMEASWREGGGSSSKALEEFLAAMKLK